MHLPPRNVIRLELCFAALWSTEVRLMVALCGGVKHSCDIAFFYTSRGTMVPLQHTGVSCQRSHIAGSMQLRVLLFLYQFLLMICPELVLTVLMNGGK